MNTEKHPDAGSLKDTEKGSFYKLSGNSPLVTQTRQSSNFLKEDIDIIKSKSVQIKGFYEKRIKNTSSET